MCPRAIIGKHCTIDITLWVMKTRLLIKLHLGRGQRPERCEEAAKRLTPSTIRYQVRRSWVPIPFPATFFTHEISVKVYLYHLAVEVVRGTCESCKMYQFISCCRCTWIKKMYLKKLHIDRKAKHAKTHFRTAEQKKWPWQLICKSICWPAPLNYCQAIPIVFLSTKLNTHNIKKMWRKGGRRGGGGLKEERRGNLNGGKW